MAAHKRPSRRLRRTMPLTAVACGAAIVIPLSSHGPGSNASHGATADVAAASAQPATTGAATPSGTPSATAPTGASTTAPTTPAGSTQSAPPAPQPKPDQDDFGALSISTAQQSQRRAAPAYVPRHAAPASDTTTSDNSSDSSTSSSGSSSSSDSSTSSSSSSSATTTTAPASSKAAIAIAFAEAQLGKPYAWGGTGPNSWDCSGLVQAAYAKAGITLPRVTYDQVNASPRVSLSDLQPGDLIFYYSGASHVGIYIGNGEIIHAPHTGAVVEIAPYNEMPIYAATRPSA